MSFNAQTRPLIVLAGATGGLGLLIAKRLFDQGASYRAIVRRGTGSDKIERLKGLGAAIVEVDFTSVDDLAKASMGASCVVSALNGLEEVIIGAQTVLLDGAVAASVPRFIPSDFSLDFTRLPDGSNRNLDLRRRFHERLDRAPIARTSILNGAFMDMLVDQMPIILNRFGRVLYVGDIDQELDFTTMADIAAFTAAAARESSTPDVLRIAGDVISARGLAAAASEARGRPYKPLRIGSLGTLSVMIKATRALTGGEDKIFPPWQGMQYMRNMFSGAGKLAPLDNTRYPDMHWTTVREMLATR